MNNNWILVFSIISTFGILLTLTYDDLYNYATYVVPIQNSAFDVGHYDHLPLNSTRGMMAMEELHLNPDSSIDVVFGQNDYKLSTGYRPIPNFVFNQQFQVNDTFAIACLNPVKDGYGDDVAYDPPETAYFPSLSIVKYLGPNTIEGNVFLSFWHDTASIPRDMPCNYPEIVEHSVNVLQVQEQADLEADLEKFYDRLLEKNQ